MTIALRRATANDAHLLATHRARLWRTEGGWHDDVFDAVPAWVPGFARYLDDGTYVAWIAEDAGTAVGSAGVHLLPCLPRPGRTSMTEGRVHGVFVDEAQRRRGIASALLAEIVAFARARDLVRLTLRPTPMAKPLYAGIGFIEMDEMALPLGET